MSSGPKFLTLDQVLALHQLQIDQFGGSHGVKDESLLLSALAAAVFLQVNGFRVIADEDEFEELVLNAAQSKVSKDEIADFFRQNTESQKAE